MASRLLSVSIAPPSSFPLPFGSPILILTIALSITQRFHPSLFALAMQSSTIRSSASLASRLASPGFMSQFLNASASAAAHRQGRLGFQSLQLSPSPSSPSPPTRRSQCGLSCRRVKTWLGAPSTCPHQGEYISCHTDRACRFPRASGSRLPDARLTLLALPGLVCPSFAKRPLLCPLAFPALSFPSLSCLISIYLSTSTILLSDILTRRPPLTRPTRRDAIWLKLLTECFRPTNIPAIDTDMLEFDNCGLLLMMSLVSY